MSLYNTVNQDGYTFFVHNLIGGTLILDLIYDELHVREKHAFIC